MKEESFTEEETAISHYIKIAHLYYQNRNYNNHNHIPILFLIDTESEDNNNNQIITRRSLFQFFILPSDIFHVTKDHCYLNPYFSLNYVINAILNNSPYIPYHNNKLSYLLKQSLSGHFKTCVVGTISISTELMDDNFSTLEYVIKMKKIHNKPIQHYDIVKPTLLVDYQLQLQQLYEILYYQKMKKSNYKKIDEKEFNSMREKLNETTLNLNYIKREIVEKKKEIKNTKELYENIVSDKFSIENHINIHLLKEKQEKTGNLPKYVNKLFHKCHKVCDKYNREIEKEELAYTTNKSLQMKISEDYNKKGKEVKESFIKYYETFCGQYSKVNTILRSGIGSQILNLNYIQLSVNEYTRNLVDYSKSMENMNVLPFIKNIKKFIKIETKKVYIIYIFIYIIITLYS